MLMGKAGVNSTLPPSKGGAVGSVNGEYQCFGLGRKREEMWG